MFFFMSASSKAHTFKMTRTETPDPFLEAHKAEFNHARDQLRLHIGLRPKTSDKSKELKPNPYASHVNFFLERAPLNGVLIRCKLFVCLEKIEPLEHVVAVVPSMSHPFQPGSQDIYHVRCFEELADLSQSPYLNRLWPVTRHNWTHRGLTPQHLLQRAFLVTAGVERLVQEWKKIRTKLIATRDGTAPAPPISRDLHFSLHRAGSSTYKPPHSGRFSSMLSQTEYMDLLTTLAPIQSDGSKDRNEWNLFHAYVSSESQDLRNVHGLSDMLQLFVEHTVIATASEAKLTTEEKAQRDTLGPKAVRALQRLSGVLLPESVLSL